MKKTPTPVVQALLAELLGQIGTARRSRDRAIMRELVLRARQLQGILELRAPATGTAPATPGDGATRRQLVEALAASWPARSFPRKAALHTLANLTRPEERTALALTGDTITAADRGAISTALRGY